MIEPTTVATSRRSAQIKSGLVLFLLLNVVVFTLQNTESIAVVYLWMQFSMPRALILFLFFVAGFLSGLAVCNWKILIKRKVSSEL